MKCVGVCGLVTQCDKYQLGGNEKAISNECLMVARLDGDVSICISSFGGFG